MAETSIGSLAAQVTLSSEGFTKGVQKASDSLMKFNKDLSKQVQTFGMTERAAKIWEMQQQGAVGTTIQLARALDQQLTALEKNAAATREAAAARAEANKQAERTRVSLVNKDVAAHAAAMDRGRAITEQYLSPQERLKKTQAELNALFRQGAINATTYNRALQGAHATAKPGMLSGMGSGAATLLGVGGGLAAAFTAVQMARKGRQAISDLENVGDHAASAGVGVEEFMRATGRMKPEDVGATTTALTKMGKSMAELAGGDKEKAAAFKKAGLDPDEIRDKDVASALETVAKAFMNAKDPVKGLQIAYAAFGKSAAEVIPILDKLAKGDGTIGGKFAGMTPRDIKTAEKADEALTKVGNTFKNLFNQSVVGIAEAPGMFLDMVTGGPGKYQDRVRREMEAEEVAEKAEIAKTKEIKRQQEEDARKKKVDDAAKHLADTSFGFQAQLATSEMSSSEAKAFEERRRVTREFGENAPRKLLDGLDVLDREAAAVKADEFIVSLKTMNKDLDVQVQTFGMSEIAAQKYAAQIKMLKAGIDEMHPRFKDANDELAKNVALMEKQAANNRLLGLQQEAEQIAAGQKPFAQQIQERAGRLREKMAEGMLAPDEAAREMGGGFGDRLKEALQPFRQTVGGSRFGSGEDFAVRARFEQGQLMDNKPIQEQIRMALEQIRQKEEEQNRHLERIGDILQGIDGMGMVN